MARHGLVGGRGTSQKNGGGFGWEEEGGVEASQGPAGGGRRLVGLDWMQGFRVFFFLSFPFLSFLFLFLREMEIWRETKFLANALFRVSSCPHLHLSITRLGTITQILCLEHVSLYEK